MIIKLPEVGTSKLANEVTNDKGAILGQASVGSEELGKFDPSTVPILKVSPLSGANKKKLIISQIFSAEGTAKNRKDGSYKFPGNLGNGSPEADPLRDAIGKYWTYSDDGKEIIFLNPFVNNNDIIGGPVGASEVPVTIHISKPILLEGEIWPEYSQEMIITPNLDWLFKYMAKPVFDKAIDAFEPLLKAYMQFEEDPEKIQSYIDGVFLGYSSAGTVEAGNLGFPGGIVPNVLSSIKDWWNKVMELSYGSEKGCKELSKQLYGDESFADEICTPWLKLNTVFVDHVLEVGMPMENNLSEQYQPLVGVKFPYYSLKSEYNFYIQSYENILKQFKDKAVPDPLTEKILPNIYPFISSFVPQALTGEKSDYNKYKELISLGGIVKKPPKSSKRYFSKWAASLGKSLMKDGDATFDILQTVGDKYKMVLFPMYYKQILQDYDDQKFMFPMYNELDFSTGVNNIIGDTARQTKLANNFINFFVQFTEYEKYGFDANVSEFSGIANAITKRVSFVEIDHQLRLFEDELGNPTTQAEKIIDESKLLLTTELEAFLATLNLDEMFTPNNGEVSNLNLSANLFNQAKDFSSNADITTLVRQNTTFITVDENDDYASFDTGADMQKMLLSVVFVGKLKKMAKQKFRSYKDIMSGKTNYSETVLYAISKRIIDPDTGEAGDVIQSYYFLNTSEVDVLRFIDSQVNYNVKYQYDIEAIVLSLGTDYRYHDPEALPYFSDTASVPEEDSHAEEEKEGNHSTVTETKYQHDYEQKNKFVASGPQGPGKGKAVELNRFGDAKIESLEGKEGTVVHNVGVLTTELVKDLGVVGLQPGKTISINDMIDQEAEFDNFFGSTTTVFDGKQINSNTLSVNVKIRTKPNYKLLRVKLASVTGRVLDKPPIFPDVLITPYKGINSKLLINLNQNIGEYFMKPIFFNANDKEQYQNQLDAQKVFGARGTSNQILPIKYKGDDQLGQEGYFEVYRMNKRPQTYQDFQGHLMTELRGFHDMEVGHLDATSVSLRDDILPNRKYYYTFRMVDVHGHVSNPSAVFEVEMVDDNGTVYMLQKIIEMQPPNIKDVSKTAKKYIQIKPTFEQTIMSVDAAGNADATAFDYGDVGGKGPINLGVMPVAVWGKKFKIRITSKSSGKQVDLNVTFKKSEDSKRNRFADNHIYMKDD